MFARAHPRGRVFEEGGWRIATQDSPLGFFNVAHPASPEDGMPPESLAPVTAAMAGVPDHRVWVRPGMERAESLLQSAGYELWRELPSMWREPQAWSQDATPDVQHATTREEIEACFFDPEWGDTDVADIRRTFPDPWAAVQGVPATLYFVRREGRLAAVGRLQSVGDLGGIYGMWTHPAARRQGLATELVKAMLTQAKRGGLKLVTLEASEMGERLYARLGFSQYTVRTVYCPASQPARASGGGSIRAGA